MSVEEVTPGNFRSVYGTRLGVEGVAQVSLIRAWRSSKPVRRCEWL